MADRLSIRDLVKQVEALPPFDHARQEVAQLTTGDGVTAERLAHAIEKDQALAECVLAAANTIEQGQRQPVTSLLRAVIELGFRQVHGIVLRMSVVGAFQGYATGATWEMWRHAFAAATAARMIAARGRVSPPEEAFLIGLMQNFGQLFLRVRYAKDYDAVIARLQTPGRDVPEVESEIFGADHQEIGYLLARRWRMPEAIVQAIRFHHDPVKAGDFQGQAALAHLGDVLASALGFGSDVDPHVRPLKLKAPMWEALGVRLEDLEPVCAVILAECAEFESSFGFVKDTGLLSTPPQAEPPP